jgi:hypothetical protein
VIKHNNHVLTKQKQDVKNKVLKYPKKFELSKPNNASCNQSQWLAHILQASI